MATNSNFIHFNFNLWKAHTGDCAIRAIVAATGLDYRVVCKKLGVSYKKGKGLIRDTGIDLDKIEEVFSEYFDIVEDFYDNYDFVPDEFKDSKEDFEMQKFDLENGINAVSKTTLNDFIIMFKNQGQFLVSLEANPTSENAACRRGGHIVYVNCNKHANRQGFIDTWDSGDMYVDTYMRVAKKEPKDSPLHWKYDYDQHKFII